MATAVAVLVVVGAATATLGTGEGVAARGDAETVALTVGEAVTDGASAFESHAARSAATAANATVARMRCVMHL